MKKIYVAGRTSMIDEVRIVQAQCIAMGHEITHDWTSIVEAVGGGADENNLASEQQATYARYDMAGVIECALLIMVAGPDLCGTLIEVGMAMVLGKQVWIVGTPERESVFFHLPNVVRRGPIPVSAKDQTQLTSALRYLP